MERRLSFTLLVSFTFDIMSRLLQVELKVTVATLLSPQHESHHLRSEFTGFLLAGKMNKRHGKQFQAEL